MRVPDHLVAELADGELHTSPRPAPPHAHAASTLGMDIGGPFQRGRGGPGGWRILHEPELHLDEDVLVPDLAGWRRERLPEIPDIAYFSLPTDWVCEVLPASTRRFDRVQKLPIYAHHEVRHAWLVDPEARTLEVYRLENGHWILITTFDGDTEVRAEPFEAVALDLAALWPSQPTP